MAGFAPLKTDGPGFVDGKLEEATALHGEEVVVYNGLPKLVPAPLLAHAPQMLVLCCVRGYHKERPRLETTAAELVRIMEWREAHQMQEMLLRRLDLEQEFHEGWPTHVHGEDCLGHLVFLERIEEIDVKFLSDKLPRELMLEHRAQVFETLGLQKQLISLRRSSRVYKHISVVDLKGLTMGHFGKNVREVIKHIISLGSNYYPESLWRLYLVNAPTVFRAIWACIKPMVHPETLAKTFILGGERDYLPIFQREGLSLDAIPLELGGRSRGITARTLCTQAIQLAQAAVVRYPGVSRRDLLKVAVANLSPGARDMAGAASEVAQLAESCGAAEEGAFLFPPDEVVPPQSPSPPHSARRASFDIPGLRSFRRDSVGNQAGGEPTPTTPPRSPRGPVQLMRSLSGGIMAVAGERHAAQAHVQTQPEVPTSPQPMSPATHPLSSPTAATAPPPGAPAGRAHEAANARLKRSFCCGCCSGPLADDPPPARADGPVAAGPGLARVSEVQSLEEEDEDEDEFLDARDNFSVYSQSDAED